MAQNGLTRMAYGGSYEGKGIEPTEFPQRFGKRRLLI